MKLKVRGQSYICNIVRNNVTNFEGFSDEDVMIHDSYVMSEVELMM